MPSRRPPNRPSRSSERRPPGRADTGRSIPGRLDEQLCFALYAAANAMGRVYAPLLKGLGLTYLQYLVLLVLWEGDGRSVTEIGRRLYLDSGTLTPVLRRLEQLGFVSRRRPPEDEREVRIRLTAAGARLQAELTSVRAEVACRAALDPAAVGRLREELRALRAALTSPADVAGPATRSG